MTEKDLFDQLWRSGEVCHARSHAYSFASEMRSHGHFARVLMLCGLYFVLTDEDQYNHYWEMRKSCRAFERSLVK